MREPFTGRYYGIINVEGDSGPSIMFTRRDDAEAYLAAKQALPEDDDNHLDVYHQIFPVDVVGAWWNSYDPDPRAALDPSEVIAAYNGEESK